jgi:hypothetical protein
MAGLHAERGSHVVNPRHLCKTPKPRITTGDSSTANRAEISAEPAILLTALKISQTSLGSGTCAKPKNIPSNPHVSNILDASRFL